MDKQDSWIKCLRCKYYKTAKCKNTKSHNISFIYPASFSSSSPGRIMLLTQIFFVPLLMCSRILFDKNIVCNAYYVLLSSCRFQKRIREVLLNNPQNSQKNTCARVSFLIQFQVWPATVLKEKLWYLCFL